MSQKSYVSDSEITAQLDPMHKIQVLANIVFKTRSEYTVCFNRTDLNQDNLTLLAELVEKKRTLPLCTITSNVSRKDAMEQLELEFLKRGDNWLSAGGHEGAREGKLRKAVEQMIQKTSNKRMRGERKRENKARWKELVGPLERALGDMESTQELQPQSSGKNLSS